jgi:hypothetical protein
MPTVIVSLFLIAHALIHVSFLSPRPAATASGPAWPFDLAQSWLLSPLGVAEPTLRVLGIGLIAVVLVGYAGSVLATVGVAPAALFVPLMAVACVASIVVLAVFFHPWLVLGFLIDGVLLWATLGAGWRPGALGLG